MPSEDHGMYVDGDVVVYQGHEVARLSPKLWPSLRDRVITRLTTGKPVNDDPEPEPMLSDAAAKWLTVQITIKGSAGLLSVDEIADIIRKGQEEGVLE